MEQCIPEFVIQLREWASAGRTPSQLYDGLRLAVGDDAHMLTVIRYFQLAFHLDLHDVKPFVTFTKAGTTPIADRAFLDRLVSAAIERQRPAWAGRIGCTA